MTSKKDFKTLVRERMIKTRESYTVARMHVLREHGEGVYVDTTVYTLAVDGRWCATDPAYPGCIGYGPTKYHAGRDVSRMAFALPLSRPRSVLNVLTLIEMSPSRWTARATEQLDVCVEASSGDRMTKVVYWMTASLDGFVETRDGKIDWSAPDEELFRFHNEDARRVGAFLHGRRTYEGMASVWPTAEQNPSFSEDHRQFGRIWMRTPKVVFSKTLRHVEHNSRLAGDDIGAEVAKLKEVVEGDLALGGATLAATFMKLGLIDEYRLFVRPVVLGGGKPFFAALDHPLAVKLVETRTFPGGVVLLRYERSGST